MLIKRKVSRWPDRFDIEIKTLFTLESAHQFRCEGEVLITHDVVAWAGKIIDQEKLPIGQVEKKRGLLKKTKNIRFLP